MSIQKFKEHVDCEPYQHQVDAFNRGLTLLKEHGCYALLHEMGCGKTYTAIAMLGQIFAAGNTKALIVCPTSVVSEWVRQFKAANYEVRVVALSGKLFKKSEMIDQAISDNERDIKLGYGSRPLVVITNYESTWRLDYDLLKHKFETIICDESQRIKAPGSKQSRFMTKIGKLAKYRIIMSGTPNPENPLNWYAQYRFLDYSILGSNYAAFRSNHAITVPRGVFNMVVGYKNVEQLEAKVFEYAHRVKKEDAVDLPDEVDVTRTYKMRQGVRKIYRELLQHSITELEEESGGGEVVAMNVLTRCLRLQQITGGSTKTDDGVLKWLHDDKIELLADTLKDVVESGSKAVVFFRFTAEGERIRKLLDNAIKDGKSPIEGYAYIDGSVPIKDRGEVVNEFQTNKKCQVFVGQIQSVAEGLTLTAADTAIFYSMGYSAGQYEQARARVHRIGQDRKVTHIHLIAEDSIDEQILKALTEKKDLSKSFLDGGWKRFMSGGYFE